MYRKRDAERERESETDDLHDMYFDVFSDMYFPGCLDMQTFNSVHGRTNNPYDLTRTPGGLRDQKKKLQRERD